MEYVEEEISDLIKKNDTNVTYAFGIVGTYINKIVTF